MNIIRSEGVGFHPQGPLPPPDPNPVYIQAPYMYRSDYLLAIKHCQREFIFHKVAIESPVFFLVINTKPIWKEGD